ncbi:MAG: RluA family pseudouridine synthase [Polyangiaceae bacterium]
MTRLRFVLGPGERERVDKALTRLWQGSTRANVQRLIEQQRVWVNGAPCRPKDNVGEGAVLEVEPLPPEPSAATPDPEVKFAVVHEDDDVLVVDKPAGLVVHPARGHRAGTLVNGLLARESFALSQSAEDDDEPEEHARPGIVHRIDKDTSGLLVIAKNDAAREGLKAQLAEHSMERVYRAITHGVPRVTSISTLHGRDPRSRLRFTSRVQTGKHAVTHLKLIESLAAGRAALVECRLETGRTHQIRVHLLEVAKTPLLADALYRLPQQSPALVPIASELGRQALHAAVLGFIHPRSGLLLRFESALPLDMQSALSALRALS